MSRDLPSFLTSISLPVIAAPMFLVSGPALVIAACRAGIVGAFPASNARTPRQLGDWLAEISEAVAGAPYAVNINVHPGRYRDFEAIMATLETARVPLLVTSVGDPSDMISAAHGWGGQVLHDVTTIRHAEKAIEAGVDGLILVCAGAGGHSGTASAFSFLRTVRRFYDGLVVLGGGVGDGFGLGAAIALGADLVYMGTRFIASNESFANEAYKRSLVEAGLSDIIYTNAISGLPANFMAGSIREAGMDPARLPLLAQGERPSLPEGKKAWKDIHSAGHAVSLIDRVLPVQEIVNQLRQEFDLSADLMEAARRRFQF